MSDSSMLPPAAWYADPQDPASLRYWDGAQWTDQTRPMVVAEPVAPPQPVQAAQPAQVQQPAQTPQPTQVQEPVQAQAEPVAVQQQPATPQADVQEVTPAVQETVGFAADSDQVRVTETVVDEPIAFAPSAPSTRDDTSLYPGFAAEVAALRLGQDDSVDEVVEVEASGSVDAAASDTEVVVATTAELPGHRIVRVVGPVFGIAVRRHSDLGGGDAAELLTATRREALDRLTAAAAQAGASGVISLNFTEGGFADLVEIAVYGTGVIAERE